MKNKMIAIGLAPNRIDILLCQGDGVIASKRIAISLEADAAQWRERLSEAVKPVQAAVEELRAEGTTAVVFYRSPTELADYATLQFKSISEAKQAAILGCADSLACPLEQVVSEACVLSRDASAGQPQTHLVVAADRDETIRAIAQFVEECDLKFAGAAPIDAVVMAKVARKALHEAKQPTGYLYIGERRSFFVIASKGTLMFARPISLGLDALTQSLTRPIRNKGGVEPIELSLDVARDILHHHGFAKRSQVVHEALGLTAGQILPALQPVVQRFIIELRQSIRFGLPESKRQSVNLILMGPGSTIPGFSQIIAEEIQAGVTHDQAYAKFDPTKADSPGSELRDAASGRRNFSRLALQPQLVAKALQSSRLRRWLWVGAAASLGLVALDAVRFQQNVRFAAEEAARLEASAAESTTLQESASKLVERFDAMEVLEHTIDTETGAQIDLQACLREISHLTPGTVRLTSISFTQADGRVVGAISGYALEDRVNSARPPLELYINELRRSPLFQNVLLANVQMSTLGDTPGKRFEASFAPVGTPRIQPHPMADANAGGSQP